MRLSAILNRVVSASFAKSRYIECSFQKYLASTQKPPRQVPEFSLQVKVQGQTACSLLKRLPEGYVSSQR